MLKNQNEEHSSDQWYFSQREGGADDAAPKEEDKPKDEDPKASEKPKDEPKKGERPDPD